MSDLAKGDGLCQENVLATVSLIYTGSEGEVKERTSFYKGRGSMTGDSKFSTLHMSE